jgi:hypothetical protein
VHDDDMSDGDKAHDDAAGELPPQPVINQPW